MIYGPKSSVKNKTTDMKVHLAGVSPWRESGIYDELIAKYRPYVLESFYYVNDKTIELIPMFGSFMLDSGAFTFIQNKGGNNVDWHRYIERYAEFIVQNNVQLFFELDIDSVVGYAKVLEYRKILERLVGRQSIPVWHKSRGIEAYKRICCEYPYVAIGGYVIKELTPKDYNLFPTMIDYAHANGAKVHGLGYTNMINLRKHHFDSVDSTSWTSGNRFGYYYKFDGKTMIKIHKPEGHRIADARHCALNNYMEWLKFQRYAETHL